MAITLICSGCSTRLTVGDDRARTTFACPRCDSGIYVPVVASPRPTPPLPNPAPPPLPPSVRPQPQQTNEADAGRQVGWNQTNFIVRWVIVGVALVIVGGVLGWYLNRVSEDRHTPGITSDAPSSSASSGKPGSGRLFADFWRSNNIDKIEGKWKITALPEKVSRKNDMADMAKMGLYVYMEFKADSGLVFGVGADKPEMLDFMKAAAPKQKLQWDARYKLLPGDGVEIYELPKDLQSGGSGGLFGRKDRAKVMIHISGNEMKMTDDDGTATLVKLK